MAEKGEHLVSEQPRHVDPGMDALIRHLDPNDPSKKNDTAQPEGQVPKGYEEAKELPPVEEQLPLVNGDDPPMAAEVEDDVDPNPMVPVMVNGSEMEVPLDDLIKGYQQEASYTHKSEQLAEQRRQFEAEMVQARMEHATAAQRMTDLANQLEAQLLQSRPSQEELQQLRITDPAEYAARVADENVQMQQLAQARQQAAAHQQAEMAQRIEGEKAQLMAKEPAFAENFEQVYNDLGRWVTSPEGGGVSVEDWNRETDHRRILIAYQAWKGAEQGAAASSKASSVRAKVASLPRIRPTARKASGETEQANYDAAVETMRTTGTNRDIAKALMARRARNQARRGG